MLPGFFVESAKINEIGDYINIAVDFEVFVGLFFEVFGNGGDSIGLVDAPTHNVFIGNFTTYEGNIGSMKGSYHWNGYALLG
jgi:hypothetical protein